MGCWVEVRGNRVALLAMLLGSWSSTRASPPQQRHHHAAALPAVSQKSFWEILGCTKARRAKHLVRSLFPRAGSGLVCAPSPPVSQPEFPRSTVCDSRRSGLRRRCGGSPRWGRAGGGAGPGAEAGGLSRPISPAAQQLPGPAGGTGPRRRGRSGVRGSTREGDLGAGLP